MWWNGTEQRTLQLTISSSTVRDVINLPLFSCIKTNYLPLSIRENGVIDWGHVKHYTHYFPLTIFFGRRGINSSTENSNDVIRARLYVPRPSHLTTSLLSFRTEWGGTGECCLWMCVASCLPVSPFLTQAKLLITKDVTHARACTKLTCDTFSNTGKKTMFIQIATCAHVLHRAHLCHIL